MSTPHPATQAGALQAVDKSGNLPLAIASAPGRIWLDLGFDPWEENAHFSNLAGVTWSKDNATGNGIEYVRATQPNAAPAAEVVASALRRLLAAFPKGNADQHDADCMCVYHEAAKALAAPGAAIDAREQGHAVLPYLRERLQDHTCERVEHVSGAPGLTLYVTKLGAHPEFHLFATEAFALWSNLGKALGPALASRSEAPEARPNAAGQEQGYRVFMDGDAWCAVNAEFIDLQQSLAEFADTPYRALEKLREAEGNARRSALRRTTPPLEAVGSSGMTADHAQGDKS